MTFCYYGVTLDDVDVETLATHLLKNTLSCSTDIRKELEKIAAGSSVRSSKYDCDFLDCEEYVDLAKVLSEYLKGLNGGEYFHHHGKYGWFVLGLKMDKKLLKDTSKQEALEKFIASVFGDLCGSCDVIVYEKYNRVCY
jgi:hypothetical protein